jgi:hypothetical protein
MIAVFVRVVFGPLELLLYGAGVFGVGYLTGKVGR